MGLKNTNYTVPTGDVLETAYAIFDSIQKVSLDEYKASFNVYRTREAYGAAAPYETKTIKFVWDRKQDLVAQAYAESKKTVIIKEVDPMSGITLEKEVDGIFTGWEDDIVE